MGNSSYKSTRQQTFWSEFGLVLLLLTVGLAVRVLFLLKAGFVIDSDEAIVGLMALDILEGQSIPAFYYGQDYMGSLEAITVALAFKIFGISNEVLKLVPVAYSGVYMLALYMLARSVAGRSIALYALLLSAIAPAALILWSTKARGGFIEIVLIGTLALWQACRIVDFKAGKLGQFFGLGVILGFGWWVNNQIVFYGAALAGFFLVYCLVYTGMLKTIISGVVGSVGFFIGGIPFWYTNIVNQPRFRSISWLFEGNAGDKFDDNLVGFFSTSLPILLGSRRFWSHEDVFQYASLLAYSIYALAFLVSFVWCWQQAGARRWKYSLILLVLVITPLIFSWTRFGWLTQAPRYLLPLYSVLPLLLAIGFGQFLKPHAGGFSKFFGVVGILSILALNLYGTFDKLGRTSSQPHVFGGERVAYDQGPLYQWLAERGYAHIQADYWIGYRAAFETRGQLTFSQYRPDRLVRIPQYELREDRLEDKVYVFVPTEAAEMLKALACFNFQARATQVGEYVVIDRIQSIPAEAKRIPLDEKTLSASSRETWLVNLFDNDLGTRWGSGQPQNTQMYIKVAYHNPRKLVGIDLDHGFWPHDAARRLVIEAVLSDGSECTLFDSLGCGYVARLMGRRWTIRWPEVEVEEIILKQQGSDPVFDWSIAEIVFYKPKIEETKWDLTVE